MWNIFALLDSWLQVMHATIPGGFIPGGFIPDKGVTDRENEGGVDARNQNFTPLLILSRRIYLA